MNKLSGYTLLCIFLLQVFCSCAFAVEQRHRLDEIGMKAEKELLINKLVVAEQDGSDPKVIGALEALFSFYTVYDFHTEAERVGRIAIDKRKRSSLPKSDLALMHMRHGVSLIFTGRLVEAQQALTEGIALSKFTGPELQSNLYFNKAYIYRLFGEYDLSEHFYSLAYNKISLVEKSTELLKYCKYEEDSLPLETAKILVQLGSVAAEIPDSTLDVVRLQKCALSILIKSDEYYSITAKAELARTYWRTNKTQNATKLATEILAERDTRHPQQIDMLLLLTNDRINIASEAQKKAASEMLQNPEKPATTNKLFEYVTQLNNIFGFEQSFYNLNLDDSARFPHPIKLMALYNALIRLHISIDENDTAEILFEKAQTLSEKYLHSGTSAIAWKSARANLVDTYLSRFYSNNSFKGKFDYSGLVSLIAEVYDHSPHRDSQLYQQKKHIDDSRLTSLYSEWIQFERSLLQNANPSNDDYQKLAIVRDTFFTQLNNTKSQKETPATIRFTESNLKIPADTAIYRYVITPSKAFVLVMTRNQKSVFVLPDKDVIYSAVSEYNQSLNSLTILSPELQKTIDKLFPRITLADPNVKKLVIIADSSLHQFPFASLKFDLGATTKEYLVSHYAITHSYSILDYLIESQNLMSRDDLSISIFADPLLNDQTGQFRRLAETGGEVKAIQRTFPSAAIRIAIDASANSAFLTSEQSRQSTILHIATHGYFNPDNPEIVGLVTSPSSINAADGFLSLSELLSYPVSSQLVVIAGCETSLGKNYSSAGVKSMSRGFIAQGAETVLATLWPVQDRASSLFIERFYEQLVLQNGHISKALKETQHQFASRGRYRHPKYWAGFVFFAANQFSEQLAIGQKI